MGIMLAAPAMAMAVLFVLAVTALADEHLVGEGDDLRITVYGYDDLTTKARVDAHGSIRFPMLGELKVSGMSASGIADEITRRLADGYIIDPEVSVYIEEYRSKSVTIMGEVARPGLYRLKGPTTFLELVSAAGGLGENYGQAAVITRTSGGGRDVLTIDLPALVRKGHAELDLQVMDGDNIYVQGAGVIYVTGEVRKPDSYRYREGMTVIQAITLAGGYTPLASARKVRILRKTSGGMQVLDKVSMDDPVMPEDVIVASEGLF